MPSSFFNDPILQAFATERPFATVTQITAVYEKLQRVELPIVPQLVRQSYWQTVELCKEVGCVAHNDLPGYTSWRFRKRPTA